MSQALDLTAVLRAQSEHKRRLALALSGQPQPPEPEAEQITEAVPHPWAGGFDGGARSQAVPSAVTEGEALMWVIQHGQRSG